MISHKGNPLKKSPKFKTKTKSSKKRPKYHPDMEVPKGEMGKGPKPRPLPKELEEILKRINQRLKEAKKKQITAGQLMEYLETRKRKMLLNK